MGSRPAVRLKRIALLLLVTALAACGGGDTDKARPVRGIPASFSDADPHGWQRGFAPSDHLVHGLDVSRFQGDIDWLRAREAGVSFAFVKATEGGDRVDPMFRHNWRATLWPPPSTRGCGRPATSACISMPAASSLSSTSRALVRWTRAPSGALANPSRKLFS